MCPNCFPSLQGIAPGYIVALFICILFFVTAVGAMFFASRSGYLDDLEDTKYRMLED
jgi:nitrogen fixation-related uncharacterized protein